MYFAMLFNITEMSKCITKLTVNKQRERQFLHVLQKCFVEVTLKL